MTKAAILLKKLRQIVIGTTIAGLNLLPAAAANPERNVFFGDTHAHSMLSGDAFGFGNRLMPENAYKLARGDEADHVGGYKVKLKAPLDFFMITDHAEMLGIALIASDPKSVMYNTDLGKDLRDKDQKAGSARFVTAMVAASESGVFPEGYCS